MKNKSQRNGSFRKQNLAKVGDICRVISHFSGYYPTCCNQNLIVVSIESSYCTRRRLGPSRKSVYVASVMLPSGKMEFINLSDLVPLSNKLRRIA